MRINEAKPNGARGVAYLRVSGEKQDQKSQVDVINRWLLERGLSVTNWYSDVGPRDLAHERKEFQILLQQLDEIDWIIVAESDRFGARDSYQKMSFLNQLIEKEVELWSVAEGFISGDDFASEVMNVIGSTRSKDEQICRSTRNLRGKLTKAANGEWQGGCPPYGYDIEAVDAAGTVKFRVHYLEKWKRVKIQPDGTQESYDGKNNFPTRDKGITLRLSPSVDQKRIETLKWIFNTFANTRAGIRSIAMQLGELGTDPVTGSDWYSTRIGSILRNPAYVSGVLVYNKKAQGRFKEFVGGQLSSVKKKAGKALSSRRHDPSDYITSTNPGIGLISKQLWDKVQEKLAGRPIRPKAAKNKQLWLSGLLYCAGCNKRMRGITHSDSGNCYSCSTYSKLGKRGGCGNNLVRHDTVLKYITNYLFETTKKLKVIQQFENSCDRNFSNQLEEEKDEMTKEYAREITRLWRKAKGLGEKGHFHGIRLINFEADQNSKKIITLNAELDKMLDKFLDVNMTKAMKDRINLRIEEVSTQIEELKQPRLVYLKREFDRLSRSIKAAIDAKPNEQHEAIFAAIRRVTLSFKRKMHGPLERSVLDSFEITPITDSGTYAVEDVPGRG